MRQRDLDVIPSLLRTRNKLEDDLEEYVLILREQERLVKKYMFIACALIFFMYKHF